MTDQSIFDDNTASPEPVSSGEGSQVPAVDQLLGSITNAEGKQKYSNVEEALKGLSAAQEHIRRLEQENTEFKQKVEKSTTLQDVLEAMKPAPANQEGNGEPATPALDEGVLAELLEKVVEQRETVTVQKTNAATVANKFKELYGEEARTKYYEAAASVGLGQAEIDALAAKSPSAVFTMLGVEAKSTPQRGSVKSSVSTEGFEQKPKELPKFNPMQPSKNSTLEKWQAVVKETNSRLGIE